MRRFHQICGLRIKLSENRTVAETSKADTLFSDQPLLPGDIFSVRVQKAEQPDYVSA